MSMNANRRVAFVAAGVALGMLGLAYASVPLYRLFCQVTGFGGTTQRADAAPGEILDREIAVRFDANISSHLGWNFGPMEKEVTVKLGEPKLVFYRASNRSDRTTVGTATFNVTPPGAGIYFSKVQCFCFTEQALKAHESVDMAVQFFVDPELAKDPDLGNLKVITLSYTMYPAGETRAGQATN
jgi:cytochrome c oxidase assembly protein subunit 11